MPRIPFILKLRLRSWLDRMIANQPGLSARELAIDFCQYEKTSYLVDDIEIEIASLLGQPHPPRQETAKDTASTAAMIDELLRPYSDILGLSPISQPNQADIKGIDRIT